MFIEKKEKILGKKFIQNGYLIHKIKNKKDFQYINKKFVNFFEKECKLKIHNSKKFFITLHNKIDEIDLNRIRLSLINKVTLKKNLESPITMWQRKYNTIVGNELAMQNSLTSIQLPNDKSSLLAIHADTWSGDSPFEEVVWLLLVDVYKTKSMYILPAKYYKFLKNFLKFKHKSSTYCFTK